MNILNRTRAAPTSSPTPTQSSTAPGRPSNPPPIRTEPPATQVVTTTGSISVAQKQIKDAAINAAISSNDVTETSL